MYVCVYVYVQGVLTSVCYDRHQRCGVLKGGCMSCACMCVCVCVCVAVLLCVHLVSLGTIS